MGKKHRYKISENYDLEQAVLNMNWKSVLIHGEMTRYEVSDCGLVKSLKHNIILAPGMDTYGYPQVGIYLNDVRFNRKVHRLVAEAFIPNPENKPEINHKDGNKINNDVKNLEWSTTKENIDHAIRTGLRKHIDALSGAYHKYEIDIIHEICKLLEEGKLQQKEIAEILNVPKGIISEIKCKRIWLSVSCQYNIDLPNTRGETHHNAIYTEDQICKVCQMLQDRKYSYKEIMKITGVSKSLIANIKNKHSWKCISDLYDIPPSNYIGENHYKSKYMEDQIHYVCKLLEEGKYTHSKISEITGVSKKVISNIKYKHSWTHISKLYNI